MKFVIEADDEETRQALTSLELGAPFEIVTAPAFGPRTKPKALNVALPLVRGAFTVVYDAEDKPEPDQLRRAVAAFYGGDRRLACLQAALTIDNTADGWLTRMFTAGYAGQFDVLLPALTAMRLPLPLGGSSNHFRTSVLRKVGGWDPYNLTEDADLGMRLCRLGYRTDVVPSATYEEAPARFRAWLKQRTRWYEGWMRPCQFEIFYCNIKYLYRTLATEFTPIATLSQRVGSMAHPDGARSVQPQRFESRSLRIAKEDRINVFHDVAGHFEKATLIL